MKKYFILGAAALAMAACSKDESVNTVNNDNAIRLTASIGTQTRATLTEAEAQNTQFASGKTIFVEAYKTGETTTYTTGNYTTGDAGAMTGSLFYPSTGENIDICAFYPSTVNSNSTSFVVGATQTSAENYQAYDLMYATKLTNKAKGSPHGLTFNHALSKIIVTIANGTGVEATDLSTIVSAVKINGTKLTGTIAITNGAIAVSGVTGDAADITITGSNVTSQAGIIVPQVVAAGTFITVTCNNSDYTYALPSDKTFEAGKVYTYALTLTAAGIELQSLSIADWESEEGDTKEFTL